MKTLKQRIRQYMMQVTGTLVLVILVVTVGIQIWTEQHREYISSAGVLAQIEQFMIENVVTEDEADTGERSNLFSLLRMNSDADFYVVSGENGEVTSATNESVLGKACEELGLSLTKIKNDKNGFYAKMEKKLYFCVFERVGNDYVGRCVQCSTMYRNIPVTTLFIVFCLMMVAFILTYVVSRYMNRYVVDGIHKINEELNKITDGDMGVRVDIRTSEEFAELSDYINAMVGSLSDSTSKMSYALSVTNMFIGVYEYRKSAKPVYCTEYIPRIFSLELSEWHRLTSDYELFDEFIKKVCSKPLNEEAGVYVLSEEPQQYVKIEEIEIGKEVFGVVIDVTEDVIRRRRMREERDVDLLTGLYNRRGFENRLDALFHEPEKMGCAALVMIDADGLKIINDTYGHEMGDVYLKKIASVINNFGIQSSLSARLGGDEFVLLLYEYEVEEELINTIKTIEYIQGHSTARLNEDITVPLRFSFGYCMVTEGVSYEEMLKLADTRMYENKRKRKEEIKYAEDDKAKN